MGYMCDLDNNNLDSYLKTVNSNFKKEKKNLNENDFINLQRVNSIKPIDGKNPCYIKTKKIIGKKNNIDYQNKYLQNIKNEQQYDDSQDIYDEKSINNDNITKDKEMEIDNTVNELDNNDNNDNKIEIDYN